MNYDVEFFEKPNGSVPVQEFLLSLNPKMRAKVFSEIELLHGFVKKTQKTPVREMDRAKRYMEDYEKRCKDE